MLNDADSSFLATTAANVLNSESAVRTTPSVLFRPKLYKDGDQWCALYGENIAVGCAGFGPTPAAAMAAFDDAWNGATAEVQS